VISREQKKQTDNKLENVLKLFIYYYFHQRSSTADRCVAERFPGTWSNQEDILARSVVLQD